MAKLILISGDNSQEFELGSVTSIGRSPDNVIHIPDRSISKKHAQIIQTPDGRFLLKDEGSLNGTFVGRRVEERVLRDGDEIRLGSAGLTFRDPTALSADPQVTICHGAEQNHIEGRIEAKAEKEFLPEHDVSDEQLLRRDYERLRIARELAQAVGTEFDLDRLLQKILDTAFEMLPADRGVIMLMNERGVPVPRVVKQKGAGGAEQILLSKSILNEVVRNKQAVLSSDAMMDSRFAQAESIVAQEIRSTMCVPLLYQDDLLGIMHLDSQITTNAFSEKDLDLFAGIASQAAVAIQNAKLAAEIEWEAKTRAQFQRFFSPGMVEQMIEGRLKLDGQGTMRDVTILFSDIRGFTPMTADADAHDIVSLLNDYFELMVEVLFSHSGTLDKYVGDEIMALFGVPVEQNDAPAAAVRCAIEMQQVLAEFNRARHSENLPPIEVGIGINTGLCAYGAIGSSKTLQYTVIGDAVNVASRLCTLAKGGEVIISEETYLRSRHRIDAEAMPAAQVKGKQDKLNIFRVVGAKDKGEERS